MAKSSTAKAKPLSKSAITPGGRGRGRRGDLSEARQTGCGNARGRRSSRAEEERYLRPSGLREIRGREEAGAARPRGNQSVHEGKAEVRRKAGKQGRPRPPGQGDQGRCDLRVGSRSCAGAPRRGPSFGPRRHCVWAWAFGWVCFFAPLSVAHAKTIALYVDGPDAARVRGALVSALGSGLDITDDGAFRSGLSQAGQKRALDRELAPELGPEAIAQIEQAAREVGADAVVVVRLPQGDDKSRIGDGRPGRRVDWIGSRREGSARLPTRPTSDGEAIARSLRRHIVQVRRPGRASVCGRCERRQAGHPHCLAGRASSTRSPWRTRGPREAVLDAPGAFATSMLDIEGGVEAAGRQYSYRSGITPSSDEFSLFPAPAFGARAKLFPLQDLGRPWADIGLSGDATLVARPGEPAPGSVRHDAAAGATGARFYGRIHPTKSERVLVGVDVGYAMTSFGSVGPPTAELPDVRYRAVRAALDGRFAFGRFAATAVVGFRAMVDPNGISTRFYNPSGYGVDAEVGASFMFASPIRRCASTAALRAVRVLLCARPFRDVRRRRRARSDLRGPPLARLHLLNRASKAPLPGRRDLHGARRPRLSRFSGSCGEGDELPRRLPAPSESVLAASRPSPARCAPASSRRSSTRHDGCPPGARRPRA